MSKPVVTPPKGSRDFLPRDIRQRNYVTNIIREVYQAHGFEPLETPAFERLDTLLGKYGDEGDQLLFKILLRGEPLVAGIRKAAAFLSEPGGVVQGRSGETAPGAEPLLADLGLRYDLTVPFARVYAANQGKLPPVFKRYQIQPVWRADTPGKGRFREFYQCDVDVVGASSHLVEAEVLGAAAQCLQRLGFNDFKLRINHRGLLRAIVEHSGIAPELETEAIVAVDKLDKIGRDGVATELMGRGVSADAAGRLLELMADAGSLVAIKRALANSERGQRALGELEQVLELASVTTAASHMAFDVSLARGLGYYTGCIFEINVADLAGSLGGGGRYDGLIGMFLGRDVPACGLSLGLERILVVMEERKMYPEALERTDALLAAVDDGGLRSALELAQLLRRAGLRIDLVPRALAPGKLRKQADDQGIGAAIWIEPGATERASVWRKRDGSQQKDLNADELAAFLARKD
ncbi:MAG TPA: histidine--tRNA ligase [Polyangiales bacterium]|nr:histidine--tRNA ligase [Polyangiales bacterium]